MLEIENLTTDIDSDAGLVRAVDALTLTIERGETFALVGESGCGKSMTALSILRLLPDAGRVSAGRVDVEGTDIMQLPETQMRDIRGRRISIIFQEPSTSLNPVMTVGRQITEVIERHTALRGETARAKAVDWLKRVGIPEPERRIDDYPFQMSGGQKQRVMIAIALAAEPGIVIADEPTTALDVTIQAQILDLLVDLQKKIGTSILMITHDLGVIAETASRVIVMYAGEVVEQAEVDELFAKPHHPYTEGLMHSMPHIGHDQERLNVIPGTVPAPTEWPSGCRFRERCPYSWDLCEREHPPLYQIGSGHVSRCHLAIEPERRNNPHPPLVVEAGVAAA